MDEFNRKWDNFLLSVKQKYWELWIRNLWWGFGSMVLMGLYVGTPWGGDDTLLFVLALPFSFLLSPIIAIAALPASMVYDSLPRRGPWRMLFFVIGVPACIVLVVFLIGSGSNGPAIEDCPMCQYYDG